MRRPIKDRDPGLSLRDCRNLLFKAQVALARQNCKSYDYAHLCVKKLKILSDGGYQSMQPRNQVMWMFNPLKEFLRDDSIVFIDNNTELGLGARLSLRINTFPKCKTLKPHSFNSEISEDDPSRP
ncbi:hypothetical protein EVAR_43559_1 [Eumeta japonica]|uniref:Uncharacterized protein n=1 Tax=Eumeta variegata TaxID=151549 RepID=A0A4C1WCK5_EUMVA|nr:hypothetical protein EVAR_43559_1 [Eumeta japonica]